MGTEIFLLMTMAILLVMLVYAIRLYALTNEAMDLNNDIKQLIKEGYLEGPLNNPEFH
ncbi:MAG: hypothetical protein U0T74_11890 [Chitinophagales bacterium]